MKEQNDKIQTSIEDVRKIDEQVNQLKLGSAEKKDIQTFKFVADALGLSLDTVARWFIISIIFVFDPLAICLILAYNVAVFRREDERVYGETPTHPNETKVILRDAEPPRVEEKQILTDAPTSLPTSASAIPPEIDSKMDTFFKQYFKR
jgi:hypothetical protein